MKLRHITLTGADSNTCIKDMVSLGEKYPLAEFAILFAQSKSDEARYPSWEWVEFLSETPPPKLSAHLCGKWVDDAMDYGRITLFDGDAEFVGEAFQRVQFNLARGRLSKVLSMESPRLWDLGGSCQEIIFGGPYGKISDVIDPVQFCHRQIAPMFDSSGGRGITTREWLEIPHHESGPLWCGYAGGLGPKNIEEELQRIEEVVGDAEIWIDMETKLRDKKDEFDLAKCEEVLKIASRWSN